MFKTHYRVVQYWTTKYNPITEETEITDMYFTVEYKNLITILFDHTWKRLCFDTFKSKTSAMDYLNDYLKQKVINEEEHHQTLYEI